MKTAAYIILAISVLCGCSTEQKALLNKMDRYKATFSEWPGHVPTPKTPDAPLAGNGDIGITMNTSGDGLTFFIGKNDFWRALESYPEGGLALPGALRLSSGIISTGTYHAEQLPGSAEIRATYTLPDNALSVTSWVSATDNKAVIELVSDKETVLDVEFLPTEDGPLASVIEQGSDRCCSWMTRSFIGDERLKWESHVALALNHTTGAISLRPGKKLTLVLAVYTNLDTPDWKEKAIAEAEGCTGKGLKSLKKMHQAWWSSFWSLSHVDIGDEWMERYYYQSQYLLACSSRSGKTAPGLWGSFITSDDTAWAGDYHMNYNYQSPYWGCYSSNHICLTDNYDQPLLDYMDKGRAFAGDLLGCRGLYYPVGIGPFGLSCAAWPDTDEKMKRMYGYSDHMIDGGVMFWGQKSNASFGAVNMMMRFYATWDKSYAEKIYPYISGCAEFWEDFLVLRDGRYESVNDSFYEEWPGRGNDNDVNPMCSLGLIRMVMRGALDISSVLGVDDGRRAVWQDILDRLSDFPVGTKDDGRLSLKNCDRKGADAKSEDFKPGGLNRIHMHGVLIPPMVSGPLTTPEFSGIMLDDMNHWVKRSGSDWGNSLSNGVETVYPGAARLGYDPEKILSFLKERIEMDSYPNCCIVAAGGGIETLAAVPFTINEMLMQSFEGTVRIFPCWARSQDASFRHLRANGAFLVSSSIQDGLVGNVEILSEQGRPCRMENPWPGSTVLIRHADGKEEKLTGEFFEFNTEKGEKLTVSRLS
ncbi:MAG: trehalose hydrolase [Bacteroidales bacterium]|nr:trehalose hydrolase [Candidatus Cryptobacteroides onthequi]